MEPEDRVTIINSSKEGVFPNKEGDAISMFQTDQTAVIVAVGNELPEGEDLALEIGRKVLAERDA